MTPRLIERALRELDVWPLEKVAGQLIMVSMGHDGGECRFGPGGTDMEPNEVATAGIGGVCYFSPRSEHSTPDVARALIQQMQSTSRLPLLISADQENGLVTRLREPATRFASAMGQAATGDWEGVELVARVSAEELRAAGVNMPFAPIADINSQVENPVIGVRSPSSSPEVVARYDEAVIRGFHAGGVASCAKHFPGHGSTRVDSHVGLPVLDVSASQWWKTEAVPFQASIAAGVDSMMVGHLVVPALDSQGHPATYSRAITTELLRDEMGFDGVIITDALDMEGARLSSGVNAAVAALAAGADIALMPPNPLVALESICRAARSGQLDEDQLRRSARRVLKLKLKLAREPHPTLALSPEERRAIAADQVRESLTWRDAAASWRLPAAPAEVMLVEDRAPEDIARGLADVTRELAEALGGAGYRVSIRTLDAVAGAAEAVGNARHPAVLVTRDAWRREGDADMVRQVAPWLDCVVAARSPYDASLVPVVKPMLLVYGDIPGTPRAIAEALISGRAEGRLPTDLVDSSGSVRWRSGCS